MAHLSDGTLRRKFDDAGALTDSENRHYTACAECQGIYATLADDARQSPAPWRCPTSRSTSLRRHFSRVAVHRLRSQVWHPPAHRQAGLTSRDGRAGGGRSRSRPGGNWHRARPLLPAPVGAGCADPTVADLQSLNGLGDFRHPDLAGKPEPQLVTGAAEAASVSVLPCRPSARPMSVSSNVTYAAMPAAVGVFQVRCCHGSHRCGQGRQNPAMPAGMDGSTLTVTVGPAVVEIYGNPEPPIGHRHHSGHHT